MRLKAIATALATKSGRQYALYTEKDVHIGYIALNDKDLPDKLILVISQCNSCKNHGTKTCKKWGACYESCNFYRPGATK